MSQTLLPLALTKMIEAVADVSAMMEASLPHASLTQKAALESALSGQAATVRNLKAEIRAWETARHAELGTEIKGLWAQHDAAPADERDGLISEIQMRIDEQRRLK